MASANKKLERTMARRKSKRAKKDVKQKVGLFDKLENECLSCQKEFDRKSKEQVSSWFVTVRKEGTVNLYCPDCWLAAKNLVEKMEKDNVIKEN